MPRLVLMTWIGSQKRWTKMYRGVRYYISPRRLNAPETRAGSMRAANEWWKRKKEEIDASDAVVRVRAELEAIRAEIGVELFTMLRRRLDRGDPKSLQWVQGKIKWLKGMRKIMAKRQDEDVEEADGWEMPPIV